MQRHHFKSPAAGFSLLEVLVAVVILSVGLLALASLQLTLYRSSADTKAQTIALGLAKDKLESLRSYRDLEAYRLLTDDPTEAVNDVNGSLGGIDFTRSTTVTRYAYDSGSGAYVGPVADTATDATIAGTSCGLIAGGTGYTCVAGRDFKQVAVTVTWLDATNTSRTVALEDAVSALAPSDSAKITKAYQGSAPRPAVVRIYNPGATAGVIPIAIGGGSNTAATNPTPEVAGRNTASAHVVETRFNVLTYSGISGGAATAQSRVETAIAGCACDLASTTTRGFRPTFWDGEKYTVPENVTSYYAPGVAATDLAVSQSNLCTICCRDHHDPSGVTGALYSPRRASHTHYMPDTIDVTTPDSAGANATFPVSIATNVTPATASSGRYTEACRIIRVNGFFRVAADPYNDHADLLETNPDGASNQQGDYTLPAATSTATPNSAFRYAGDNGFVLSYMAGRFVTPGSGTAQSVYNTCSGSYCTPAAALHPASITMSKADAGSRWHHFRGLYVDYLEPAAVAKINEAKAQCAAENVATPGSCDNPSTTRTTRILKLLPFTSINLTEIAEWRVFRQTQTSNGNNVTLGTDYYEDTNYDHLFTANNDFFTSITVTPPVRGSVETGTNLPYQNCSGPNCTNVVVTPKVTGEVYYSNSGLALLDAPINLDEPVKRDIQTFSLATGTPGANSGTFLVEIPAVTQNNTNAYSFSSSTATYPKFAGTPTVRCSYATKNGGGYKKPNPFSCVSKGLNNGAVALTVSKYNYQTTGTVNGSVSCTDPSGNNPAVTYSGNYSANVCKNYVVSSVTSNQGGRTITLGAVTGTDGYIGEATPITVSPTIVNGEKLTINLLPQNTSTAPSACTYQIVNSVNVYTIVPGACP